ncbi:putative Ketosamine-3-kinase [Rhypophila sp. PSN 637]
MENVTRNKVCPLPGPDGHFTLDQAIIDSLPVPYSKVLEAVEYGSSRLNMTAKIVVRLPCGNDDVYFLKVSTEGEYGGKMLEGEYESLKEIHSIVPTFVPRPLAFGKYQVGNSSNFFLLENFRAIKCQPADPVNLGKALAEFHLKSKSPTAKFGFHIKTYHGTIAQEVDRWDTSWCSTFTRLLSHFVSLALASPVFTSDPRFETLSTLTLSHVTPRLLLPLQASGRTLKPCLIHGDCWDGNTAIGLSTAGTRIPAVFVFDPCSFYAHNEYETGNWRAPRHKLSSPEYIQTYQRYFPISEPVEDWDARNRLYSLSYNIGNALYIPGSDQKNVVIDDMDVLCRAFCSQELDTCLNQC